MQEVITKPSDFNKYITDITITDRYLNSIISCSNTAFTEQIPILEASMSQPLKHIYSGAPIMFISAYRQENTERENISRTKELINLIHDFGYRYIAFNGYWSSFNSSNNTYSKPTFEQSFINHCKGNCFL